MYDKLNENFQVKSSYSSGNCDPVRVPKLWYYELMQFTVNEKWENEPPKDVTLIVTESAAENSEVTSNLCVHCKK